MNFYIVILISHITLWKSEQILQLTPHEKNISINSTLFAVIKIEIKPLKRFYDILKNLIRMKETDSKP